MNFGHRFFFTRYHAWLARLDQVLFQLLNSFCSALFLHFIHKGCCCSFMKREWKKTIINHLFSPNWICQEDCYLINMFATTAIATIPTAVERRLRNGFFVLALFIHSFDLHEIIFLALASSSSLFCYDLLVHLTNLAVSQLSISLFSQQSWKRSSS